MQNTFIEYVFLILIILAFVMLANKLRLAYPIVYKSYMNDEILLIIEVYE